ncbi:MAG: hypothetical protein JXA22_10780 [Candidatus Thermoplasmatota archaeon]|nr:hypothetical protein [Candidatus Thermoplasmatota archaeon]
MSDHHGWALSSATLAVLLLIILPVITMVQASDRMDGAPDLSITGLSMTPTKDGYKGVIGIKNLGLSSSVDVGVVVMDLEDGSMTNKTVVVTFPLLPLAPGMEFTKEFKWVPDNPGTHLMTAVVDTDGAERELRESNNVRSLTISIPYLGGVSSVQDGDQDPDVLGEYITGIENIVELDMFFQDVEDPSIIRVYATVEGHFLEYGTRFSGNMFRASFDAGTLPPGNHTLTINSTYGGYPLPRRSCLVRVSDTPVWYEDLDRRHSYFDTDLSSYVLSGKLDIGPSLISTSSDRMDDVGDMMLNGDSGEIFFSAYILLDGTTTLISRGDTSLTGPSNTSYRFMIPQEGRSFIPSSTGGFTIEMEGSISMNMDLSVLTMGRNLREIGAFGDTIELPLPELGLDGDVKASTVLGVGDDGHFSPIQSSLDIDISGSSTAMCTLALPGYDDPRFIINISASWSCLVQGIGLDRSGSGELSFETSLYLNDMGLEIGVSPQDGGIDPQGIGTDIALSPSGNIGQLELSLRDGHTTHLVYRDGIVESEVYRNNTYKSHPDLEYLWDGIPIVVWSEAGYEESITNRSNSMRLFYHTGDMEGNFTGSPSRVTSGNVLEQHPSMASDHENERSALCFIGDLDGDATTLEDREVMVSFWEGGTWTSPERITEDTVLDQRPDLWFDTDGVLHVAWLSGNGKLRYRSWSESDGWGPSLEVEMEDNMYVEEVSFADIRDSDPYLVLVVSTPGDHYRLIVARPSDPPEDRVEVTSSTRFMGSSRIIARSEGRYDAIWRVWEGTGGDLYVSTNNKDLLSDGWTEPLRLTSDPSLELSPSIMGRADSTFDLGFIEVPGLEDDRSGPPSPAFTVRNLSWGGEVISLSVSDTDVTPGTMVIATATVSYRGLTPSGMVRADLYRVLRDRETGGVSQELWDSEVLEFHTLGQTEQVGFTVSVKEFQLGLSVLTVPALSGIPAHTSQKFTSLPALPDLEILDLEPVVSDLSSPTACVKVSIRNWGSVPAGTRTVKVIGSEASAPLVFQNRSLEPLFLRGDGLTKELNHTTVDIPADDTVLAELNITLSPGVNHIQALVEGPSWLPVPESRDYRTVISLPILSLSCKDIPPIVRGGSEIMVEARIENVGPWPLNVSYHPAPPGLPEGLSGMLLSFSVGHVISHMSDRKEGDIQVPVDELGPGGDVYLNWSYEITAGPGRYDINIVLGASSINIPRQECNLHFMVITDPVASVESMGQAMTGDRYTGALNVEVHNPTSSRIEVLHLILYDGQRADGVVISEEIVIGLGPGETRTVVMYLPLEKGLYVLSVTAEGLTLDPSGKRESWQATGMLTSDVSVMDPGPQGIPVDDDVDMGEVTTAGIITVSMIMGVLLIASLFYRKEHDDEGKE